MAGEQPIYRLEFRPKKSPVPAVVRIRRLLKYAGRVLGLTCIDLAEVPPAALQAPAKNPPGKDQNG
jgi:hypothetical protein